MADDLDWSYLQSADETPRPRGGSTPITAGVVKAPALATPQQRIDDVYDALGLPVPPRTFGAALADAWNNPAPGGIISMLQGLGRAARMPGDVLGGEIPMHDPQTGRLNPEAVERASDLAGVVTGGAFPTAAARVGMLGVGGGNPGIRAFHGSPHKFDRFDASRIGTGEGAQAYGHGLYFAENEGIARGYKERLSGDQHSALSSALGRVDANVAEADRSFARQLLETRIEYPDDSLNSVAKYLLSETTTPPHNFRAVLDRVRDIDTEMIAQLRNPGHMYEVNIRANPDQFLDWDRPLSQQGQTVDSVLKTILKDRQRMPAEWVRSSPGAEGRMQEAGIPGIKYLDQGSRAPQWSLVRNFDDTWVARRGMDPSVKAETFPSETAARAFIESENKRLQTHNYVVFPGNEHLIDILKRYGLAGLSMLPPAVAASLANRIQPVDYDPFAQ